MSHFCSVIAPKIKRRLILIFGMFIYLYSTYNICFSNEPIVYLFWRFHSADHEFDMLLPVNLLEHFDKYEIKKMHSEFLPIPSHLIFLYFINIFKNYTYEFRHCSFWSLVIDIVHLQGHLYLKYGKWKSLLNYFDYYYTHAMLRYSNKHVRT